MELNMMKNTFGQIDLKLGFQPAFFCVAINSRGVAAGLK